MTKIIKLEQISEDTIDVYCKDLAKAIKGKMNKKGPFPFVDSLQLFSKITEEYYESLKELHSKNNKLLRSELLDLAITAIWGVISLDQKQNIEIKK